MLSARDIMTSDLVAIHPQATVREAIEILTKEAISGLPVVDDADCLVGIITEFALLAVAYDPKVLDESVAQHMTTEVLSVDVNDTVRQVVDVCVVHRVRRVPVLEKGHLVGLIARRDVLKAVYAAHIACTA